MSIPGAFDRAELEQAYRDFLIRTVSEVAPAPAVPLDTVLAEGDPAQSLVTAAADAAADLLVLGIRGRSPDRRADARLGQPGLRRQRTLPGRPGQAAGVRLAALPRPRAGRTRPGSMCATGRGIPDDPACPRVP